MNNIIKEIEENLEQLSNNNNRNSDIFMYYIGLHELATSCKDGGFFLSLTNCRWHKHSITYALQTEGSHIICKQNIADVTSTLYLINKYGEKGVEYKYNKGELPINEDITDYAYFCSSYTPMYIHSKFNLIGVNRHISEIAKHIDPNTRAPKTLTISNAYDLTLVANKFSEIATELNDKKQPKNMKPIKSNQSSDLDIDQDNVVIQDQSDPFGDLESFKPLDNKLSSLAKLYSDNSNSTLSNLYNTALAAHRVAFDIYLTLDLTSGYKISNFKETGLNVVDIKDYIVNTNDPRSVLDDAMNTLKYYREEYNHLTNYIQKASEEIENLRIK